MALINCEECGKEISDKALSCPNCGCPVPYKQISRIPEEIIAQQDVPNQQQINQNVTIQTQKNKKNSTLSLIACIFSGISIILPIIFIIGIIMSFCGMVLGIVDLCINDKETKHIGSWFSIVVFLLYILLAIT